MNKFKLVFNQKQKITNIIKFSYKNINQKTSCCIITKDLKFDKNDMYLVAKQDYLTWKEKLYNIPTIYALFGAGTVISAIKLIEPFSLSLIIYCALFIRFAVSIREYRAYTNISDMAIDEIYLKKDLKNVVVKKNAFNIYKEYKLDDFSKLTNDEYNTHYTNINNSLIRRYFFPIKIKDNIYYIRFDAHIYDKEIWTAIFTQSNMVIKDKTYLRKTDNYNKLETSDYKNYYLKV
jgi:hypothetical protein